MRVLSIETSSRRGSVALIEHGRALVSAEHERLNAHAEELQPMLERLLAEAGWARSSFDRIAVGIGPGSFTGLRVGIALAIGIGLGLDVPVVGVGSLRAMAAAVPATEGRVRCALLDARRQEVFAALYGPDGAELAPPEAIARTDIVQRLNELSSGSGRVLLGEVTQELVELEPALRSAHTDLPHAVWTGLVGAQLEPGALVEPMYVRDAGATVPNLPPSPFGAAGPKPGA